MTPDGISEAHGDGWFITAKIDKKTKTVKQSYMLFVDNRTHYVFSFPLKSDGDTADMRRVFEELIGMYATAGHLLKKKVKLDNWKTDVEKSATHLFLQSRGISEYICKIPIL
jgi:hypothetical protein